MVRVHELAKRLGWTPQTSGFLRARGEYVTSPHNMLADMVLRDIQLEFAVASNTTETADDVLDPYLLVAVLLSDEFFAPGGR